MASNPCLFSICAKSFDHRSALAEKRGLLHYAYRFRDRYEEQVNLTIGAMAHSLTQRVWSPVCYSKGIRREANFKYSSVIGLDFDGGLRLEDAKRIFSPYRHLIGLTRSHSESSHRFRVLLRLDRVITDGSTYKRILSYYINKFQSDRACKDTARFYYPCTKIIHAQPGDTLSTAIKRTRRSSYRKPYKKSILPFNISAFLHNGFTFGAGRNVSVFVSAKVLKEAGIDFRQALAMIDGAPFERTGFSDRELESTVRRVYG